MRHAATEAVRRESALLTVLPYETVTFLPFYVARAQGIFADENLKIDFLYSLSGGPGGGMSPQAATGRRPSDQGRPINQSGAARVAQ